MDLDKLYHLEKEIRAGDWGPMHSFLIYRNSQLIFEEYFENYSEDILHEAQSVTKSLQSILVGIALDRGFLKSPDEPIKPYFEQYHEIDWSDQKDRITLRHLLTMTSGLQWNESYIPYTNILDNDSNRLVLSRDWILYALQKPMQHTPGQFFNYSSAAPILISHILTQATGMENEAFACQYLFEPLDISTYFYQRSPQHAHLLGDIDLLSRDLAKLGLLILNQGRWAGEQLVSQDWVRTSLDKHILLEGKAYGYWWWSHSFTYQEKTLKIHDAWGYGGQHIFIIPDLQAVVVFTGGYYDVTLAQEPYKILENFIIPVLV